MTPSEEANLTKIIELFDVNLDTHQITEDLVAQPKWNKWLRCMVNVITFGIYGRILKNRMFAVAKKITDIRKGININKTILTEQEKPKLNEFIGKFSNKLKNSRHSKAFILFQISTLIPLPDSETSSERGLLPNKECKIGEIFKSITSKLWEELEIKVSISSREDFLTYEKEITTAPPVISKSDFVPEYFARHLMINKKDRALGVKYVVGDCITNMEGALHTFVTPIARIRLLGDPNYRDSKHVCRPIGANIVRPVILSAAIQPDFENDEVMATLIEIGDEAVIGKPLPEDFEILSAEEKKDPSRLKNYDEAIRKHMIYHLTADHRLPARGEIDEAQHTLDFDGSIATLNQAIINEDNSDAIYNSIKGHFLSHGNKLYSAEMLLNSYIHQIYNEFCVLDKATPQGYIYTIDPPATFAGFFNRTNPIENATLLNRLQILAFKILKESDIFTNLKVIGFNEYADQEAIGLLKDVFKETNTKVKTKKEALTDRETFAQVIHNNSDAFGQNILTEGPSSLDGVIGKYSDAALVLKRNRPDLTTNIC